MAKQRVTLKEVAVSARVSYQTVSKVLNKQIQVSKETEERIRQAVSNLGYRAHYTARSLRSQQAFAIGYSWPASPFGQVNSILEQFLQSMLVAAEKAGYYLLCFPYNPDANTHLATYVELFFTGRVDGFVISSVESNDPRVQFLCQKEIPLVSFGRSNPGLDFPWIDVDGARGIELAVNHLVELGHRRIAALAWPVTSWVGNNRMEGYFRALRAAGISLNAAWVERGDGRFEFGYQATHNLLDLPAGIRPSALITLNDAMAIGAIWAARERGLKVGHDFAIAGFDDAPMVRYLDPPLTTVQQPIWEVGQQIIPMLLEIISGERPPEPHEVLVEPKLIIRGSTLGDKVYMK